jgi:type 1 fimbriae regulatory protein FimB/type 1 fimbriae regulatory protein FimE
MLRHACGYALANKGHDRWWTSVDGVDGAVYTALAPNRFKDFWRE